VPTALPSEVSGEGAEAGDDVDVCSLCAHETLDLELGPKVRLDKRYRHSVLPVHGSGV
jgi:hypothetical protein